MLYASIVTARDTGHVCAVVCTMRGDEPEDLGIAKVQTTMRCALFVAWLEHRLAVLRRRRVS